MSARQNKKRKGRNNVNNRERTVTTLTEDPNTSFLVPTPSEEPAGANLMSSPFSVASSSGGNTNISSSGFQMPGNFGYAYNYMAPLHGSGVHPQQSQQQFYQQPTVLPPGKNDLEILENLKNMIKEGQHEFYRATPQPAALASLYLGPLGGRSHVPPHPEQVTSDYQSSGHNQGHYDTRPQGTMSSGEAAPPSSFSAESGRRPPNLQDKDSSWDARKSIATSPVSGPQSTNNTSQVSGNRYQHKNDVATSGSEAKLTSGRSIPDLKAAINPDDAKAAIRGRTDSISSRAPVDGSFGPQAGDQQHSVSDRPGEYTGRMSLDSSPVKPGYNGKDDAHPRDSTWLQRDDDRRARYDADRSAAPPNRLSNSIDSRQTGDYRGPPPKDQRYIDRDRDRDRERDRDRDRDWERDRDRDRRPNFGFHGRTHAPRPPPEQRHYEPRYNDLPRRDTREDLDVDRRPPPARPDDRGPRPVTDDRPPRPPPDDRVNRGPLPDNRAGRPPVDDRSVRPPLGNDRVVAPSSEDRTTRISSGSGQPAEESPSAVRPALEERGRPAPTPEERSARPPVPLEERISQAPSLQDRLDQPPATRADTRVSRQPSLEERLSHAPVPAPVPAVNDRPPHSDDRPARPPTDRPPRIGAAESSRPLQDERPLPPDVRGRPPANDRFARPVTPQDRVPPRPGYVPPPRPASVARDDFRAPPKASPTTADRPEARDYRTARELSRERPELRPGYRPELDRGFNDDRRPDIMDVDAAARFADHRPPYRRLTPPPVADARTRGYYPPPSPSRAEPASVYDVDADRRFPPGDRRDWQFDRRREWSLAEEDKTRTAWRPWDRTMDRDRYERDVPPVRGSGWEAREDRDRRPYYPGSPTARSVDGSRPLSSRLTEGGYPAPGEERGYPPRDLERSRYPPPLATSPPPFSRVRGRSPSPIRRGGPGNATDDMRPPMKRAREDPPYPGNYYSPPLQARRGSMPGGPIDYPPPRSAATPPPSSGGSFYDSRVGPPTQFSAVGQPGGGPPLDREYTGARDRTSDMATYGSSSYDRDVRPARSPPPSRMPPPPYARSSYNPRDDRRYMPPPPRTS